MKSILGWLTLAVLLFRCSDDAVIKTPCGEHAVVRDLRGLDGCGFVFELDNGKRLEPQIIGFCGTPPLPQEALDDPLFNFQFVDGKSVYISYEVVDAGSICMVGPMVRITSLTEEETATRDL